MAESDKNKRQRVPANLTRSVVSGARSKRYPINQRITIASIVQGLPFHQQLDASQSLLLRVTPVWHEWCEQQRSKKGAQQFSAASDVNLSSFTDGVLTLACINTATATKLKNHQPSLIQAFHAAGFEQIERVQIKMALTQAITNTNQPDGVGYKIHSSAEVSLDRRNRQKPSDSSIKSLEAVQSRIKNEHLLDALQRLAETLKKQ